MVKKKKKRFGAIDPVSSALDQSGDYLPPPPSLHPGIPPAATGALQAGANPQALDAAKKQLGNENFINLCEAFAEQVGAVSGRFPSAIQAFIAQKDKAQPIQAGKPGDAIYFSPTKGNQYGHVGVISGNGNFISATPSGVKEVPIDQWVKYSGEEPLGVVPKGNQ